ncbi:hypothetical protein Tco_1371944, partial [Tanacetum coccineum]
TGLVNEFGNGGNGDVNEYGNEGLESSSNGLKKFIVNKDGVANVNMTSGTCVDSVMAGHDNLDDENVGHIPSNSTANSNKGTSYAKLFTRGSSRKSVNFCTLITLTGNETDVVVPLESITATSEWYMVSFWETEWLILLLLTMLGTLEVKLHGVLVTTFSEDGLSSIATKLGTSLMLDSYTFDMCMQSWGRSSYARAMIELRADVECAWCNVFGHVRDECPTNISSDVVKNLKNPNQAPRGVPVGPYVGFKPVKQVYRPISKKNNANARFYKKKEVESRKRLIIDEKLTLVDDKDKPLEKVNYSGDHNTEDEVEPIDN